MPINRCFACSGGTELGPELQMWPLQCSAGRRTTSPRLLAMLCPTQPKDRLWPPALQGCMPSSWGARDPPEPRMCPSLCCCLGLFLPRGGGLHPPGESFRRVLPAQFSRLLRALNGPQASAPLSAVSPLLPAGDIPDWLAGGAINEVIN